MAKQRRSFAILGPLTVILVLAVQGTAQTTISYGQTIVDSITIAGQNKTYQFSATANDLVRIKLVRPPVGSFDYWAPYITIYNPNGSIFIKSSAAQPTVLLDTLRFPATGTYTILIADASGTYTGKFNLYIQRTFSPAAPLQISYGETHNDSISLMAQNKTYQFSATANDLVRIKLVRPPVGSFDYWAPYITIYNPNGSIFIKSSAAQPTVLLDTLRFPATGTYTILIADASGPYTGKFNLYIQRTFSPAAPLQISYGETHNDSISLMAQNKTYQFSATANDLVRIELVRPPVGSFDYWAPYITIYNPNGSIFIKSSAAQPTVLLDTLRFPATGTYTILIADASGPYTGKFTLSIFGIIVALQPPTLISPSNGSLGISITPTFSWNLISGATNYKMQISTLSDFSQLAYQKDSLSGASWTVTFSLSNNTQYYWRVEAKNAGGDSVYSDTFNFTTIVAPPTLSSPTNGATGVSLNPTLSWNSVSGATSYELQVSVSTEFSITLYDGTVSGMDLRVISQPVTGLSNGTVYYWRVNAINAGGTSSWSTIWSFTTIGALPGAVTLVSPKDTASISISLTDSLMFVWNKGVSSVTKYQLQIASDSGMGIIFLQDSTITDTTKQEKSFAVGGIYFWRVRAGNAAGWGPYSQKRSFKNVPIAVLSPKSYEIKSFSISGLVGIIRYTLPKQCFVSLKYYDLRGRMLAAYVNKVQDVGEYAIPVSFKAYARGTYIQVFEAGNFVKKDKIAMVR